MNNCLTCGCETGEIHKKDSCFVLPMGAIEANHFDDGKLQLQWLLSMRGLDEVAKVGSYGAKKYGQSNWRGGSEYMRYLGSIVRHVSSYIRGESVDKESGLNHLAHAAYNCLIILTWQKEGKGTDDRPK